ncbi:MAG: flagellar biosynthesis regulator FlaF [Pseudomonadota bacterium]
MALMTAHAFNAQSAYGNTGREIGSDKDVEVQVFQTAIARLRPLMGLDFKLTPTAAETLSENLKLWDTLTLDLIHPENQTADDLKAQLIGLAKFVRAHTIGLYGGNGTVDVLVDINTAVLKGLLGQPGTRQATAGQAA